MEFQTENSLQDITWEQIQETAEENPEAAQAILEMLIEAEEDVFKDAD